MTEFVKRFVEENIEPIEQQDWSEVVSLWYGAAVSDFSYSDDEFNELSKVLSSAGIPFMELSLKARKDFVISVMSQYLEDEIDTARYRGNDEIKKNDILMMLVSDLGFIKEELEEFLDDVAENVYKIDVDFTCYYV